MFFSVIYSIDCSVDDSILKWAPPGHKNRKMWSLTEKGSSEYEMFWGSEKSRDAWRESKAEGKHRKWTAVLTRKQFDAFVDKVGLCADSTETMGSIGAPGFGFGWAPAVCFAPGDYDGCIRDAYVTPVPSRIHKRNKGMGDKEWQKIRNAVVKRYR